MKKEVPLEGWEIVQTNGLRLLGKRMKRKIVARCASDPRMVDEFEIDTLEPVYELRPVQGIVQLARDSVPILASVELAVAPLMNFDEVTWIAIPEGAFVLPVSELLEKTRAMLAEKIENMKKALASQRAGLIIAKG